MLIQKYGTVGEKAYDGRSAFAEMSRCVKIELITIKTFRMFLKWSRR